MRHTVSRKGTKMHMRRIALALVLATTLVGCGSAKEATPEAPAQPAAEGTNDAGETTFSVTVTDEDGRPVPDVVLGFCLDDLCEFVECGEDGTATFTGEDTSYHVKVLFAPEGYVSDEDEEVIVHPGDDVAIVLARGRQVPSDA